MKKILSLQTSFIIYLFLLIHKVNSSSELILQKFGSVKTTDNSMIFNTSQFNEGDDIYIIIDSELDCDEYISYQFYDNINEIYKQTTELKYIKSSDSYELTNIFGKKTHLSLYYTIKKEKNILDNLKGDILYFEFKCEGEVEIKNSKKVDSKISAYIGNLFVIFFLIICFILCFQICLKCFICIHNLLAPKNENPPPPIFPPAQFIHYPVNGMINVMPDLIYYNNNSNNINNNYNILEKGFKKYLWWIFRELFSE